jgi:hypothetical protein
VSDKVRRDPVPHAGHAALRYLRETFQHKRAAVAEKEQGVSDRKEERAAKRAEATDAVEQLASAYERCAAGCACGEIPCPMLGMRRCDICWAAGRPSIKPRLCSVRECIAARKEPALLALGYTPPTPLRLQLMDEEEEDAVGDEDEVMPAAKLPTVSTAVLCDWACTDAVMTAREAEHGYCSGRRCKAKMHHFCFLHHAGEAWEALGCFTRFCKACWAQQ